MSTSTPLTNVSGGTWASGGTLTLCNVDYLVLFYLPGPGGVPRCVITVATGSGRSYEAIWSRCGTDYVEFGIGTPEVCTGEVAPCDDNTAIVRVAKAHCKYTVPGWYCIRDCGSTGGGVAALLDDRDATDMTIEILDGPFTLEAYASCYVPPKFPCDYASMVPEGMVFTATTEVVGGPIVGCANDYEFVTDLGPTALSFRSYGTGDSGLPCCHDIDEFGTGFSVTCAEDEDGNFYWSPLGSNPGMLDGGARILSFTQDPFTMVVRLTPTVGGSTPDPFDCATGYVIVTVRGEVP